MRQRSTCGGGLRAPNVAVLVLSLPLSVAAAEWPSWRGPEQCGLSRESDLPGKWSRDAERTNLLWSQPLGARSTPVAWGGRVYTIRLTGDGPEMQEEVVCFDGESGKVLWRYPFNVFLTDIPSTRVGWASPCVDPETGNVYAHGVQGLFLALDRDGKLLWQRSLTEEYGRISGYGGRTHTPVIDEDRVVISFLNAAWGNQARGGHRYLAFDKRTGEVIWWSEPGGAPEDTTYSTPVIAVVDGVRLLIAGNADGNIYAMKSRTGERVWMFQLSKRGINSSVVYKDGLVYACHSEENQFQTDPESPTMGRVVCFRASGSGDITQTHEVWRIDEITAGYASPAADEKYLYVGDNSANIHCIELKTGKRLWVHSVGTVLKGSPVLGDGKLYIGEVNGRFSVLEVGEKGARVLSEETFLLADGRPDEINGSPVIAGGRVYFATFHEMLAIGKKERKPEPASAPALPPEAAAEPGAAPRHMQVIPGEVALTPRSSCSFRARLFDGSGRFLRECRPEWSLKGLAGRVDEGGELAVGSDSWFQGGLVAASLEGLEAVARVRVVPQLPLAVDFENLAAGPAPPGWVGATPVKFRVADAGGNKVLEKLADNPRFILANLYFGLPTMRDYTVQADVMGTEEKFQMPDMGVFNSRYRLELIGNRQRARVVTWAPMPRLEVVEKFAWQPNVWYTLKLRVALEGNEGIASGKVWKRGEPEPPAWLLEVRDPRPNESGAPGLYAYSAGTTDKKHGAKIFYDNIVVTPND